MTLQAFRDMLLTADSTAQHYKHKQDTNYTRWQETGASHLSADSRYAEAAWSIRVERYTQIEYDPVVEQIHAALDIDEISFTYRVQYNPEYEYIVHIWDCTVQ